MAHRLATELAAGELAPRTLDALKRSLEELRRARSDYLALQVRRGELIDVEEAQAAVGTLATRALQLMGAIRSRLSVQVGQWLEDDTMTAAGSDERRARVVEWYDRETRGLRAAEADAVERLKGDGGAR